MYRSQNSLNAILVNCVFDTSFHLYEILIWNSTQSKQHSQKINSRSQLMSISYFYHLSHKTMVNSSKLLKPIYKFENKRWVTSSKIPLPISYKTAMLQDENNLEFNLASLLQMVKISSFEMHFMSWIKMYIKIWYWAVFGKSPWVKQQNLNLDDIFLSCRQGVRVPSAITNKAVVLVHIFKTQLS